MTRNHNAGDGAIVVDVELEFLIFDQLPRDLRDALNYAWFNYPVEEVALAFGRGGHSAISLAQHIRKSDSELASAAPAVPDSPR